MTLSTTAKNAMLDELGTLITHIGLADSGAEVTGGSYARQPLTWSAAAAGVLAMAALETFSVPGGEACDRVLLRGHLTNPTPDYGFATFPAESFGSDGELEVSTLEITLSDPA